MVSKKKILNKDEVDLVQFIKVIWNYKIPILLIIVVSMLSGIGMNYSKITNTKFVTSVPYSILYHTTRVKELCVNKLSCLNRHSSDNVLRLLDKKWNYNLKNNIISFTSSSPSNVEEIYKELNKVNKILTDEILDAAKYDLNEIEKGFKSSLNDNNLNDDLTRHYLKIKRIIYSINNGKKAIYFGDVNVDKIDSKIYPILIFSLIIGTFISLIYVAIMIAIINVKKA